MCSPHSLKWFALFSFLASVSVSCGEGGNGTKPPPIDTVLVKPDGTGDYPTIQAAIDAADSLEIIELTDGIFSGEGNRNIDFLGKTITVRSLSGNPELCIVDPRPEISISDPGRGFNFHSGEPPGAVLQGITIRYGRSQGSGGGIACVNSSPTIQDCIIDSCVVGRNGGGSVMH